MLCMRTSSQCGAYLFMATSAGVLVDYNRSSRNKGGSSEIKKLKKNFYSSVESLLNATESSTL